MQHGCLEKGVRRRGDQWNGQHSTQGNGGLDELDLQQVRRR